jgi:hypothetical protein
MISLQDDAEPGLPLLEGRNKQTVAEAIRECQECLGSILRDCVQVEHRVITKNAFKSKSTVGLMLSGVSIDTVVVGGPGHAMADKLRHAKITHVDGTPVTPDNVLALLMGNDQPGTTVLVTVKSAANAKITELTLTRAATSQIADRCALYEMFTQLNNRILKDKVGVGKVPSGGSSSADVQGELLKQIDSINRLWGNMILAGACRVSE